MPSRQERRCCVATTTTTSTASEKGPTSSAPCPWTRLLTRRGLWSRSALRVQCAPFTRSEAVARYSVAGDWAAGPSCHFGRVLPLGGGELGEVALGEFTAGGFGLGRGGLGGGELVGGSFGEVAWGEFARGGFVS